MQKITSLFSLCAFVLLASCGDGSNVGTSSFSSSGTINLLTQNITQDTGKNHVIALLVPSSGIGSNLSQAAEMAVFELKNPNIELKVIHSGESAESAIEAAQKAIDSGARMILGPLFSAQAKAITPLCQQNKIPVFSFSNDKTAAAPGIYVLGYDPREQASQMADYIVSKGYSKIAAFASYKPYAKLSVDALAQGLATRSERLIPSEPYTSLSDEVVQKYKAAVGAVDAIFLPESGAELNHAAALLTKTFAGSKPFLFGPLSWGESTLENATDLRGSVFSALSPSTRLRFQGRYKDVYGSAPATIATLAYDSVALAGYLATTSFNGSAILNRGGFSGIDGTFVIKSNGTVSRDYHIAEVTAEGLKVVR